MREIVLLLVCACAAFCQEKLEFEVVSVKPSAPPGPNGMRVGCHGGPGTDDPTLLVCQNLDLANLVNVAYRVSFYQLSAPDWMHQARYDVRARVPVGSTKEQITPMWQNMLTERFKLVVHHEMREFQSYSLVLAKGGPKFKAASAAAPSDQPHSGEDLRLDQLGYPAFGPGHPGMGVGRGLARMYFPKQTMERLAGQLSGQLGGPVQDATGLTGEYEIGMYWASDRMVESSPDIGPTLIQALRDQLGLRLESKKNPLEVLVVDHCERVPSDN